MHSANDNTPVTSEELRVALVFLIRTFLSRLLPESLVLFPDATSAVGNVCSTGALGAGTLSKSQASGATWEEVCSLEIQNCIGSRL